MFESAPGTGAGLLIIGCALATTHCDRGATRSSAPPVPLAASSGAASYVASRAQCARLTATVAISGDYSMNPMPRGPFPLPHGKPSVRAFFGAIDFSGGPGPALPERDLLELPRAPGVAQPATDLCSTRRTQDGIDVSCLDDEGAVVTKTLDLRTVAPAWVERAEHDNGCVLFDINDEVGARDLERVAERWRETAAGCRDDAQVRHVTVVLELRAPPRDQWFSGNPMSALVRLRIPALGIEKELGTLGNYNGHPERIATPHSVELITWDGETSTAATYQVGRTLFSRVDMETSHPDDGDARGAVDRIAMRSLELPCGTIADFTLTILDPLRR